MGGARGREDQGVQRLPLASGVRVCPDQAECGEFSPFVRVTPQTHLTFSSK